MPRGPSLPVFVEPLGCLPLRAIPPICSASSLCLRQHRKRAWQEARKILCWKVFFFKCKLFFFFWVEVGHSRGDRVRASSPGYCIPLPW